MYNECEIRGESRRERVRKRVIVREGEREQVKERERVQSV